MTHLCCMCGMFNNNYGKCPHTWERIAEQYEQLYKKLVGEIE